MAPWLYLTIMLNITVILATRKSLQGDSGSEHAAAAETWEGACSHGAGEEVLVCLGAPNLDEAGGRAPHDLTAGAGDLHYGPMRPTQSRTWYWLYSGYGVPVREPGVESASV